MPRPEVLEDYYAKYYGEKQEAKVAFHGMARLANHILRYIPTSYFLNKNAVKILDYGGGDGSLCLEFARKLRLPVDGDVIDYVDVSFHDLPNLSLRSLRDLRDSNEQYDLVIASAVLEHVPLLRDVLVRLLRSIAPNGYFYARTPYVGPFLKLTKRLDFTFPAHVHDLGPQFWNRLMDTFDIEADIISSRPSIVETTFRQAFLRSMTAHLVKLPAVIEMKVCSTQVKSPWWHYVGGWEIVLKKTKA
jgi:SAM-dependent methyltransferase